MLFTPRHDFLVGIDSDGCVFDSMVVKQVKHFHPLILRHWELQLIEPQLRAMAEYVNLRSRWRGSNRFTALLKTFDLLEEMPSVQRADVLLPDLRDYRDWVESGQTLDNNSLAAAARKKPSLQKVLDWSLAVNQDIATRMEPIPPFDGAADALSLFHARADVVVVSLTPVEALNHEWTTHGLRYDVDAIAGQEWGTKPEQLRLAMSQKIYDPAKVLLIGDAPGDFKAAKETGVLFYPIVPGREVESWHRLLAEDMDTFFRGSYAGDLQLERIAEFEAALSDQAPQDF